MRKPRIIFFDIDGTLIDMEKKRITKPTLDALRRLQQNGILLAIATGRSPLIVPRFDGVEFDVFLTYNGSYCYDRRGDIFASPIPPQDVQTHDPKRRCAGSSGVGRRTDAAALQRNG
ncbi:MAG: HAD hydrolase family protein [Faecalibacterium sp.]